MEQLTLIDRKVNPDQVYLVVDGMTGQDAVNSAKSFNEALELDGVIMTKLDGECPRWRVAVGKTCDRSTDQVHWYRRNN